MVEHHCSSKEPAGEKRFEFRRRRLSSLSGAFTPAPFPAPLTERSDGDDYIWAQGPSPCTIPASHAPDQHRERKLPSERLTSNYALNGHHWRLTRGEQPHLAVNTPAIINTEIKQSTSVITPATHKLHPQSEFESVSLLRPTNQFFDSHCGGRKSLMNRPWCVHRSIPK